jgi:hypothetical protein
MKRIIGVHKFLDTLRPMVYDKRTMALPLKICIYVIQIASLDDDIDLYYEIEDPREISEIRLSETLLVRNDSEINKAVRTYIEKYGLPIMTEIGAGILADTLLQLRSQKDEI